MAVLECGGCDVCFSWYIAS